MIDLRRLRAHPDNKTKQAMQRDCEQAADELEALRKDAERYRWLRDKARTAHAISVIQCMPGEMDSAIDEAMQAR